MRQTINDYLNLFDFDVRKTHDARFVDQKCLPDVVSAVADCIMEYTKDDHNRSFTKNDIWFSDYASELITSSFCKPDLTEEGARSEYDKFFAQPMKMFAAAGILHEEKISNNNVYVVAEREMLEFISMREKNACDFIYAYLVNAMSASGLMPLFDRFFADQDKQSLSDLQDGLKNFYHTYTPVKKDYEPPRIFNKFINIMAFHLRKRGVERGFLSEGTITLEKIRYNCANWRDVGKDKRMTRQEYQESLGNMIAQNEGYYTYQVTKAKKFVRSIEPFSEVHRFECYPGTQAHHIFMASEFPMIADCPENIICLSPNQHFQFAHPNNRTQHIDRDYQLICLLSKLDSIEINRREGREDYVWSEFINVLNIGMNTDKFNEQMGYEEVKFRIMKQAYYQVNK